MREKMRGFSLIELLFVVAVLAFIAYAGVNITQEYQKRQHITQTVKQFHDIFRAARAYLLSRENGNEDWPANLNTLIDNKLLKSQRGTTTYLNPWGKAYTIKADDCTRTLWVLTEVGFSTDKNKEWPIANRIASELPNGFVISGPPHENLDQGRACISGAPMNYPPNGIRKERYVVAALTWPAIAINQSRSPSEVEILPSNSCFKAKRCFGNTKRTVEVAPVAVAGILDSASQTNGLYNVYPLQAFQAYTILPAAGQNRPVECENAPLNSSPCPNDGNYYVRVCLDVTTTYGRGEHINNNYPGQVLAMSYCKMDRP